MNFNSFGSLMPREGQPSNSSVNSNLNSNELYNITSILDSFENGSFYEIYGANLGHLLGVNIQHELDNILLSLNSELIPCVLNDAKKFDKEFLQECFEKIRLIKQKFSRLYKFLRATKCSNFQGNYEFVCSTCEQAVTRKSTLSGAWGSLQQHDHFQQALVHSLTPEDKLCSELLSNQSSDINNTSTNISLIMADTPKTSEPSVSENGSPSTTVSDYSLSENIKSTTTESSLQKNDIILCEPFPKKENCSNCGLQTRPFFDFKFDFPIRYDKIIEKTMYWPRDNFANMKDIYELGQPFLQFKAKQLFTCLLCHCDVPSYTSYSVIQEHISGNRHIRKKWSASVIEALFAYHEHWKKLEPRYQAHQTYFLPLDASTTLCVPCGRHCTIVPYDILEDHINSENHKESFFKSCEKVKSKRFFDIILKLQGEVYVDKEEMVYVCPNNLENNGYEKEGSKKFEEATASEMAYIETDEVGEENKSNENINQQLAAIKIKGTSCTEEEQNDKANLVELDRAESFQERRDSNTSFAIKNKHEKHVGTSESDIRDMRLNLRRTLAESAVDKSNAALKNETSTNSDESLTKNKQQNHVIFKAVENESGTELQELLEHRFLPHLKLFAKCSINTVKCQCCKVTMSKHPKVIKEHICSKDHQIVAKIPSPVYQFYCEICNVTLRQDKRWRDHLHLQKHVERCERLGASRKNKLTEHECETCRLVIFGDDLSIKRHVATAGRGGRFRKVKEIVLSSEAKTLFKSGQYIQERSSLLVREANKVLLNQDPVRKCCLALQTALADAYPNCKAYPFGSRVSGLGNENSDLDVFVDMGDMYMGQKNQDARNQEKFVISACKIFRKKKDEFSHVNPIPTARTPIVQVYHTVSKLDCDLSFRHGLSVENTKFLRLCIDLQPITQSLVLLLKQWVECCKLQESITTYALCMMVIFHLQVGGYLMPVHELRQLNPDNVSVIDGWGVVDFSKSITSLRDHIVPYLGSVTEMLKEFFYYYSRFNYTADVICPLLGRPIKKALFVDKPKGEDLPLEMLAYVLKLTTADAEYFRARSPFCIQDPFDLSHNLVKACNPGVVDKLKTFCDLSFKHLSTIH